MTMSSVMAAYTYKYREMELVLYVTQVGDIHYSGKMVGLSGWGVSEQGWRKGPWTTEEDKLLSDYVTLHGEGRWSSVARYAGLNRSGKSCRLRWVNYLRPGLKRGQLTPQEEGIIIELHALWGNKWSAIARCLPGRTDNEIKNYWRTHFKNKAKASLLNEEKPKTKCMRRELLKQKQQEEQQQQQFDLKSAHTQVEESTEYKVSLSTIGRQDMAFSYMHPINLDDYQYLPNTVFPDGASSSDSVGDHDGLWGGLWNLDDVCAQFNHPFLNNNKLSDQNQFAPSFT